ncbi:MAG: DsrE family protein [Desulfovibrionaceae bacterium CG1_02_65_16]|nr:MAG: DsrE family protein [Desulfovibrionaceae bacterium CG1_02_65_16]
MTAPAPCEPKGLVVLWTSGDREVAMLMALMYAKNSRIKDWWEHVRLVVWGPAARLLSQDAELQAEVAECQDAGVRVEACKACADHYGVAPALTALGIEVIYMGEPLTRYLKDGWKVLSV